LCCAELLAQVGSLLSTTSIPVALLHSSTFGSHVLVSQVLSAELPALVGSLSFKKSMRWNAFGAAYSRPLRWLLALHGSSPLSFSYGGLSAGDATRVLRNAAQPELQVRFGVWGMGVAAGLK
jgi:glycyl-tRNA synthetase beta subunit